MKKSFAIILGWIVVVMVLIPTILALIFGVDVTPVPPPTATSTPITITWNKDAISSPEVQVIIMSKESENPTSWGILATSSAPNTGSYTLASTTKGYVQIACPVDYPSECYASEVMGPY